MNHEGINNVPVITGRHGPVFDPDVGEFLNAVEALTRGRSLGAEDAIHDILREGHALYFNMKKLPISPAVRKEVRRNCVAIGSDAYLVLDATTGIRADGFNHPMLRPGLVAMGVDIQHDSLSSTRRPTRWAPGYVFSRLVGKANDIDMAVKQNNPKEILKHGVSLASWSHAVYAMTYAEKPPGSIER